MFKVGQTRQMFKRGKGGEGSIVISYLFSLEVIKLFEHTTSGLGYILPTFLNYFFT